jgi:cyanobactin maturation PatA/PatG family protease
VVILTDRIPGIRELWQETLGDQRVCIAVLDGPVDLYHPCFKGADLTELRVIENNATIHGAAGSHGTHIASILFGQSDTYVRGVAPCCRGLAVPVFRDPPDGPCTQEELGQAILAVIEHGAHVINISGGQLLPRYCSVHVRGLQCEPRPLLRHAIDECEKRHVLVIAAAGNEGCECIHIPGSIPSVLVVGSLQQDGEPHEFSNWGPNYSVNGVVAPGGAILGAVPGGGTAKKTGTSLAAAIVTGIAGLLLSHQTRSGRPLDPLAVRDAILRTAIRCDKTAVNDCGRMLGGKINIAGAMAHLHQQKETSMSGTQPVPSDDNTRQGDSSTDVDVAIQVSANDQSVRQPGESAQGFMGPGRPTRGEPQRKPQILPSGHSLAPAACSCGGGSKAACTCGGNVAIPVYVIGKIAYDFVTYAREDSISTQLEEEIPEFWPPDGNYPFPFNVRNPIDLLRYLRGYKEIEVTGYSAAVRTIHQPKDANGDLLRDQLKVDVEKDPDDVTSTKRDSGP